MKRTLPLLILALLVLAGPAFAQYTRSRISGFVKDVTGAVIPGVNVTISSPAIGLTRTVATDDTGYYVASDLPSGTYQIVVEHPGFKAYRATDIRLDSDARLEVEVRLTVGAVAERIVVEAVAPPVDVNTGEIARQLSFEQVRELPLPGRNPYYMLGILPGAVARGGQFLGDFRGFSYSMGGIQINGQKKDTNFVTIDGINNSRVRDGVQVNNIVPIDFIEEVKILTTHYSPENGRTSGAQINYVTRRGTNAFHGGAFEFWSNDKLAAAYASLGIRAKPRTRFHNYGWNIGGPIYIPGRWNTSKQKAFFFVGQEFRWLAGFNSKFANVPTPQELSGDFSQSLVKPIDPLTRLPFPNNRIPEARIGPNSRAIQKLFPAPNYTGPGGNYFSFSDQPQNSRDEIYRVDYNLKPRWLLSGRYTHGFQDFTSWYDNTGNNIPLFQANRGRSGNNFVLALNTTVGARTLNEFSVGYSDFRETFKLLGEGMKRSTYGFTFREVYPANRLGRIPTISISPYTAISPSGHPTKVATPTYVWRDNFTHNVGRHTLKFGMYLETTSMNDITQANDSGAFGFGASRQNPLSTGVALADALLGNFDGYSEAGEAIQVPYVTRQYEWYAQDSWKVRPNLSLEYGMRYAIIPPWRSKWNNISAFMISAYDPKKAPLVLPNGTLAPGTGDPLNGVVIPGSGFPSSAQSRFAALGDLSRLFRGRPDGFVDTRYTNFQPRLSFAWDPFKTGKTSIRGGAGIFHGRSGIQNSGFMVGGNLPFVQQVSISNGQIDNPGGGTLFTVQTPVGIRAMPEEYKLPTVISYSFGVQRELPGRTLVDVSYVGNGGRHLLQSRELNWLSPEFQRANPGVDLRRFFPYYGLGGLSLQETSATSSYNSLQVAVTRRLYRGLMYGVAYTLAKQIGYGIEGPSPSPQDPTNLRLERSLTEEDRRHNLVISYVYELPEITRKWRARQAWMGHVLGGWQISGAMTFNTGRHFNPGLTSASGQVASRPNVSGNPNLPRDKRTLFKYFDTSVFSRPPAYTYGNSGRFVITGPGTNNFDFSAMKNFRIHEDVKLQFRAEIWNLFNHPSYNGVATTLGRGDFGGVNSFFAPRYMQLGLKLYF